MRRATSAFLKFWLRDSQGVEPQAESVLSSNACYGQLARAACGVWTAKVRADHGGAVQGSSPPMVPSTVSWDALLNIKSPGRSSAFTEIRSLLDHLLFKNFAWILNISMEL